MWSKNYDKCINCNKTEIKHCAKGLCEKCYKLKYHHNHKALCSICDKLNPISKIENSKVICKNCYKKYLFQTKPKICSICNNLGRIDKIDNNKLICSSCYEKYYRKRKIDVCSICNKTRKRSGFINNKSICGFCYRRLFYVKKKNICDQCGKLETISKITSDKQKICHSCYKKIRKDYYRALDHLRRTKYIGKISEDDLITIKERDKACVYCGSDKDLCFDHIIPISKGGKSEFDNFVLACKKCNLSKRNQDVFEWCENRGIKVPDVVLE